ncbi:YigZ family protein [Marinobacterium sp. YM272]|uniref:YigZ family protein n=1 Tax=Marinobacterium sp. YM272 TaxID=3421654 RepID=UPI003D7FDC74
MEGQYRVPVGEFEVETEVKKSRFIATGVPVASEPEMRAFIDSQRRRFPSANHHCSAYVIGAPAKPRAAGSDDDGEPSGTAGKPMLNVLMGQEVGDVCVVVTRFFGGIKLGAGGLVRAYGAAVKELLAEWPLEAREPMAALVLRFPYDQQGIIDSLIGRFEASVGGSDYGADVSLNLQLPQRNLDDLTAALDERGHLGVSYKVEL